MSHSHSVLTCSWEVFTSLFNIMDIETRHVYCVKFMFSSLKNPSHAVKCITFVVMYCIFLVKGQLSMLCILGTSLYVCYTE
jgi:hypothetical protein